MLSFLVKLDKLSHNGVKNTKLSVKLLPNKVQDTIENGVKKVDGGVHLFEWINLIICKIKCKK
mgnify:CR=1 FL=1